MANATSLRKRISAVAVAALGAGLLAAVPAQAAVVSATVTPVRYSETTAVRDLVPYSRISWAITANSYGANWKATVALTAAPTFDAVIEAVDSASIGAATDNTFSGTANGSDSLSATGAQITSLTNPGASATTATMALTVNKPGRYVGTITTVTSGNAALDTVNFDFTTTGAVSSWTFTSAASSILVGGATTTTVTLRDAAGNTTQPSTVDSVALSATAGTFADGAVSATDIFTGAFTDTFTGAGSAGTRTLTATPQGTLVAAGLSAATLSISESGTITTSGVTNMTVTNTEVINSGTYGTNRTAAVPAGTSSVTVRLTGTASTQYRLKLTSSAGTVNGAAGTTAQYALVTTSTAGTVDATITLGGAALIEGATLEVQLVNALNADTAANDDIVVTQTARAISGSTLTPTPGDQIVRQLGTTTSVTVNVADQFGAPVAGATVRAYRSSTFLTSGTSNAAGDAVVTVSGVSTLTNGSSETYTFRAIAPNTTSETTSNPTLVITYTTTGEITSLSVTVADSAGNWTSVAPNPVLNTTTAMTVIPVITVPSDGTADDNTGDQRYTVSTGVIAGTATAELIKLTADATANNSVVWTMDEGAKVSTSTSRSWSAGSSSLEVNDNTAVYVHATKTGLHTITATSGGKTVTIRFFVVNQAGDAYTVSVAGTNSINVSENVQLTISVADVFGNAVDTGSVLTVAATGTVLLAGLASSAVVETDTTGSVAVTVIGNGVSGEGLVTVTGATSVTAWASGYTAPTGAAAPVRTASRTYTVVAGKSAAELAAEAAEAEAAKATAAAAAAEAAAKAAGEAAVAEAAKAVAAAEAAKAAAVAEAAKAVAAAEAAKAAAVAEAAKATAAAVAAEAAAKAAQAAAVAEAAKATAEAAKATAAIAAVQTSVTAIQTAMSTLVASFTSTLLILQNNLKKVMKKLGIK